MVDPLLLHLLLRSFFCKGAISDDGEPKMERFNGAFLIKVCYQYFEMIQ